MLLLFCILFFVLGTLAQINLYQLLTNRRTKPRFYFRKYIDESSTIVAVCFPMMAWGGFGTYLGLSETWRNGLCFFGSVGSYAIFSYFYYRHRQKAKSLARE